MDYYIIPAELARRLSLTGFRDGDEENGYVANTSDLAPVGLRAAMEMGARYASPWEARQLIERVNRKKTPTTKNKQA